MSLINSLRKGCADVFNAFLVSTAKYAGFWEFPRIDATQFIPNRVIPFSKAVSKSLRDFDCWVHFFEDDCRFERLWRNPRKYVSRLRKFNGVILPDFSLYRDMPLVMQLWNIYRSRAIGHWLQENGIKVIPNIRFGDKRTYRFCCCGIEKGCVIAVGSHGNIKGTEDRECFLSGFDYVVKRLSPSAVVIYGSVPDKYFKKYQDAGLRIISFESEFAASHKETA